MAFGDGESAVFLLQTDGAGGFQIFGLKSGAGKLSRKGHGETARVSGREQFFGVSSRALLEPAVERIRCVGKSSARHRDSALPALQISLPLCACYTLHIVFSLFLRGMNCV